MRLMNNMACPFCKVPLSRGDDRRRTWDCYNPNCPLVMVFIDHTHENWPWQKET